MSSFLTFKLVHCDIGYIRQIPCPAEVFICVDRLCASTKQLIVDQLKVEAERLVLTNTPDASSAAAAITTLTVRDSEGDECVLTADSLFSGTLNVNNPIRIKIHLNHHNTNTNIPSLSSTPSVEQWSRIRSTIPAPPRSIVPVASTEKKESNQSFLQWIMSSLLGRADNITSTSSAPLQSTTIPLKSNDTLVPNTSTSSASTTSADTEEFVFDSVKNPIGAELWSIYRDPICFGELRHFVQALVEDVTQNKTVALVEILTILFSQAPTCCARLTVMLVKHYNVEDCMNNPLFTTVIPSMLPRFISGFAGEEERLVEMIFTEAKTSATQATVFDALQVFHQDQGRQKLTQHISSALAFVSKHFAMDSATVMNTVLTFMAANKCKL